MTLIELALAKLFVLAALAAAPDTSNDCGMKVCVYATGDGAGTWTEGDTLSRKTRQKEAQRYKKRRDVDLSVAVVGGRGSVFVDGRYLPTSGPHAQLGVKPGKHEIEVRDGELQVAVGVVKISVKANSIALVVHRGR